MYTLHLHYTNIHTQTHTRKTKNAASVPCYSFPLNGCVMGTSSCSGRWSSETKNSLVFHSLMDLLSC